MAATGRQDLQISCEYFPPRDEAGAATLTRTRERLEALGMDFFSVTYGAGGSTRDGTRQIVLELAADGIAVAPHLSHSGDESTVMALLDEYRAAGVRRIVALRGDTPSGMGRPSPYFARDLVELIRRHSGDWFTSRVAAYPEVHPDSTSVDSDLDYFRQKVEAGANSAITQYFYNADAYFRFRDLAAARGIDIPIYAGIMPITNYASLRRFSDNCGAEIPRWIARQLESFGDDGASLRAFGVDVVSALCERLLAHGAPGLHFYSLNRAKAVTEIWRRVFGEPAA